MTTVTQNGDAVDPPTPAPVSPVVSDDPWEGRPYVPPTEPDPHANCPQSADLEVTCDRCGKTYQCSPDADYFCAVEGDHCCEPCLIYGRPIVEPAPRTYSAGEVIDADVDEVTDSAPNPLGRRGTWRRTGECSWRWHMSNGRRGRELAEVDLLAAYGPVTEVVAPSGDEVQA